MYLEFIKEIFSKFITNTQLLTTVAICLFSALIVYRLNFAKEKFNEIKRISNELFVKLTKERNVITPMYSISKIEFDSLATELPIFRKIKFTKMVNAYYKAKKESYRRSDKSGAVFYEHNEPIKEAIDNLLKFLK